MVDVAELPRRPANVPDPNRFGTFSAWLHALTEAHGMQRDVARVCRVEPQAVTKWLNGGGIGAANLKRLAAWVGLPYPVLRMLADGHEGAQAADLYHVRVDSTAIEVGERWQRLPEALRILVVGLIQGLEQLSDSSPAAAEKLAAQIRSSITKPKPAGRRAKAPK